MTSTWPIRGKRAFVPLALFLACLGLLSQCAREPSGSSEGGLNLAWSLTQEWSIGLPADSLRLWILDGDGRPLRPVLSAPLGAAGDPVDLALRVPAGQDLAVWLELTRPDSSRLGASGQVRGSTAAGGARGLTVTPGLVSTVDLALRPTIPALRPVEAVVGESQVTLRWTHIEGAIEYELLEEWSQGSARGSTTWVGADTFRVVLLSGQDGFSGLREGPAMAGPGTSAPAESTFFQVRSHLVRGTASGFSNARAILPSDLIDLPMVTRVWPRSDSLNVPDSTDITVAFDHEMAAASRADTTVTLEEQPSGSRVSLSATWPAPDTLRLHPLHLLARGQRYLLRLRTDLKDLQGRPLDQRRDRPGLQGFESRFTAEVYNPLRVVAVDPVDESSGIDLRPSLRVFLNRKARRSSVDCASLCTNVVLSEVGGAALESAVTLAGDSVIQVMPRDSLRYSTRYVLTVTGEVRDLRGRQGEPLDQVPSTSGLESFQSFFRTKPEPPEPVGPYVVWIRPPRGEANAPVFRPVQVRFSHPVQLGTVSGHDSFTLRQVPGDAIISSDPVGDAERMTFAIRPRPTYNGGLLKPGFRYRVVITSGVLDDAGISFDQDSTARGRQPFVDSLRAELCPRVRAFSPAAGAQRVPLLSDIRLTFSQPMSLASVNQSNLVLAAGGVPVSRRTVTVSPDSTVLTITPEEPLLSFRQYTVRADSALLSTRGSRLDEDSVTVGYQPFNLRFTTMWESLPPQVIASNPVCGPGVATNTSIWVQFDHRIATRSIRCAMPDSLTLPLTFYLEKLAGDTTMVPVHCATAPDSLYAYLTPDQELEPATTYRVTVTNWVMDRFDTRLDQDQQTLDVREPFLCVFQTASARPGPRR